MTTASVIYATSARVGRTVSQLLGWKRLTQKALAEHLDLPQSSISDAIAGRRRWTVDELEATAQLLDVEIEDLVSQEGPDPARLLAVRPSRWRRAHVRRAGVADVIPFRRTA